MLDVLLSQDTEPSEKKKTLEEEFGIPMTTKLKGDVDDMCNLSIGVFKEGIEEGIDRATVDHIIKLMKKKNWDIEECLDTLDIPEEKREVYKAAVEAELQPA